MKKGGLDHTKVKFEAEAAIFSIGKVWTKKRVLPKAATGHKILKNAYLRPGTATTDNK